MRKAKHDDAGVNDNTGSGHKAAGNDAAGMRMRLLGSWGRWASRNWGKTLFMALAVTLVAGIGVSRLQMELTYYSLLPSGSPQS